MLSDVLGEITLLYHWKMQLRMVEHQTELTQLQNSYQAVQRSNTDLKQKVLDCKIEISQKNEEQDQLMEENEMLQRRKGNMQSEHLAISQGCEEVQDSRVSRFKDLLGQEDTPEDTSDKERSKPLGMPT